MPLDEEFVAQYTDIIKPILENAGFSVDRTNDIENQRNILRDIIESIHKSDLIIADLTSANPNVFYELGLAHAFRKPVILLTQSIDEVPFDLKSYRILEYNTHFKKIDIAKEKLASYANGFRNGKVRFGNPVTDFFQDTNAPVQVVNPIPSDEFDTPAKTTVDERGYIDHLIDINKSYTELTSIMGGVTEDLEDMSTFIGIKSREITEITSNPGTSSPAAVRAIFRQLAKRIGGFTSRLKLANIEYATAAQDTEDSLEFVFSFHREQSNATEMGIEEQIQSLRNTRSSAIGGRDSFLALAKTMDELPRMERRLNREVTRGSEEIRIMASNIDKTIASISRAIQES